MATVPVSIIPDELTYPSSDGRPMAETDWHRILMMTLIQTLEAFYAALSTVYVSGNILVFYEEGNRRRHVSPDVLVVKGVPKRRRHNYLIWAEGRSLDVAIELTSRSTRREDLVQKFELYRDTLRVKEYFLFDPLAEYLKPPLQGYRLQKGLYVPIKAVAGRLPSQVMGLHLERNGEDLRLYNPATGLWLPTPEEAKEQAEAATEQAEAARKQEAQARRREAKARREQAKARQQIEAENERLRQELNELRRRLSEGQ